jgi:4-hydroxybutyrate CoA-transferase
MDWQEEYKKKLVSPEEAAGLIRSGDRVMLISLADQPKILPKALAERKDELENVEVFGSVPSFDPGWYGTRMDDAFIPVMEFFIGNIARPSTDNRYGIYNPVCFSAQMKPFVERPGQVRPIDVFVGVVSPPDRNGFCSFGAYLWNKKSYARIARTVIAEVDENQIRTHGSNYIHVSEIDAFVEHTPDVVKDSQIKEIIKDVEPPEKQKALADILTLIDPALRPLYIPMLLSCPMERLYDIPRRRGWLEPPEDVKTIVRYVSTLIKDGDCLQLGTGTPSGYLFMCGAFDDKNDLGYHGEMSARGISRLVKEGIMNGRRKTIHKGKVIMTSLAGTGQEDLEYFADNPQLELHDAEYVVNIKTISQNDNQVSLNNVISVDLTGQINCETVFGGRMWNGTGGQPESHIGAVLSKGGKAISLLKSTAQGGAVSRIVPQFEEGTAVSIPRYFADYVVTEYGIAHLMGKNCRERSEALISIAHPDYRDELKESAKKLFYP